MAGEGHKVLKGLKKIADLIREGLKFIGYGFLLCLCSPVYLCIGIAHIRRTTAQERRLKRVMKPVKGLDTSNKSRRRLSITSTLLEEGQASQEPASSDSGNAMTKIQAGTIKVLSKIPCIRGRRLDSFSGVSPPSIQQSSGFLTRLPIEIRLMIYNYVIPPRRMIHLVTVPGKLASILCPEESNVGCYKQRWRNYVCLDEGVSRPSYSRGCVSRILPAAPVSFCDDTAKGVRGALDLLCVCRKVYTEAITVLYKGASFQMDLLTFLAFSISVPEQRLKQVTKLEISGLDTHYLDSYYYMKNLPAFHRIRRQQATAPSNQKEKPSKSYPKLYTLSQVRDELPIYTPRPLTGWQVACTEVLPRMTGLRELKISIRQPSTEMDVSLATERYLLLPLSELRLPYLCDFEVRVGWKKGLEEQMWEDMWPSSRKSLEKGQGPRVAMWRPNVYIWEEKGVWEAHELVEGDGRMEGGWDSYVRKKGEGEGATEGQLWADAPFRLVRDLKFRYC
ncbi:hypothetical protein AJ79_00270 [Helicocarpus griseus UAMH5409]|uniref:DUF7730 domain-containing protein n=1 Tax=Helicocarpus griseus UAMH5409 TaxID=1447875 RepID=A0A2B7YE23_9EURO|nr:hypothetical protein AJ79_00270 [Helicocarpus griseus UAMH5409]